MLFPLAAMVLVVVADIAARRLRGRSLRSTPQAAVWAAVLSILLWTGLEGLNQRLPVWTYLGWPRDELPRYVALGCLHATVLPALLALGELFGAFRGSTLKSPRRTLGGFAACGGLLLVAAAARGLVGSAELGFGAGCFGLWLWADGLNAAAGGASLLTAPFRVIAANMAAGLVWAGWTAAASSLGSAERFWIGEWPTVGGVLVMGLPAAAALLAGYRLAGRLLGLPVYPADSAEEGAVKTLGLS